MGATHKAAMAAQTTPPRIPTIHQLNNYITTTRRRLKSIEDIEGTTKCAKFLISLQGQSSNPAPAPAPVTIVEEFAAPSDSDSEGEDFAANEVEILAR
jgi:hypothetical protein